MAQAIPRLFAEAETGAIDAKLSTLVASHCAQATAEKPAEPAQGYHAKVREIISAADHVILLSDHERGCLDAIGASPRVATVVRNPVDSERFATAGPEKFINKFGIEDFVLCCARIEPRKNQLLLLHALRDSGIPIVLLGAPADLAYFELIKKYLGPSVHVLGRIEPTSDLLPSAYAASRVAVLPSWAEGAPLVALEAAASGTSLVLSNRSSEREYFGELAKYCDPGDPASIRNVILEAFETKPDRAARDEQKRIVASKFSWENHIEETSKIYESTFEAFLARSATRTPVASRKMENDGKTGLMPRPWNFPCIFRLNRRCVL